MVTFLGEYIMTTPQTGVLLFMISNENRLEFCLRYCLLPVPRSWPLYLVSDLSLLMSCLVPKVKQNNPCDVYGRFNSFYWSLHGEVWQHKMWKLDKNWDIRMEWDKFSVLDGIEVKNSVWSTRLSRHQASTFKSLLHYALEYKGYSIVGNLIKIEMSEESKWGFQFYIDAVFTESGLVGTQSRVRCTFWQVRRLVRNYLNIKEAKNMAVPTAT